MSGRIERERDVDHRKAGTDEQGRFPRRREVLDSSSGVLTPRIADELRSRPGERGNGFRLLVAACKHQCIRIGRRAVVQYDAPAFARSDGADGSCVNNVGLSAFDRILEDFAEVTAEQPPLREFSWLPSINRNAPGEMIGFARPRAHSFGPNIEKVDVLTRRIGDAATNASTPVNEE